MREDRVESPANIPEDLLESNGKSPVLKTAWIFLIPDRREPVSADGQ